MEQNKLPIGYWIKQADQSLTQRIDQIQSQFGFTRADLQVFHLVHEQAPITRGAALEVLAPLMGGEKAESILMDLTGKGLLSVAGDVVTVTDTGKHQHTDCLEQQQQFRQSAMSDISSEQYQLTVQTLQHLVENIRRLPGY